MLSRKTIIISALIVGCCLVLLNWLFDSKYSRFKSQNPKYHADFAAACDSILANHPLGTNKYMELSVTDTSLAEIIRNLHPERIKVSTNWVWIWVDSSHTDGLSITWEPRDESQTNIWNLIIGYGEGKNKVVYVSKR
ncbi:hypothetical protein [Pedosphaera parvula]|uniref:Lipoprotein n=1 Tax=Pedosphaera parvula (strain Ellin514) TaxID=320771 RepID=B9XMI0_PEDPL|nr:hypothetical protein [Pedosphaera parvula]EEF59022.1 hypothetical protein Cflav_PD2071 [Pedosphaera parvula Ellin514]